MTTSTLERVGFVLEKYKDGDASFVELLHRVKTALETSEMGRVPVEQIRPYAGQPREFFNKIKTQQLSNSIDVTAQIQAGMIRRLPPGAADPPVLYELVDGERRWRAICLIPAERRPYYKSEIIEADDEVVQFLIAGMANFNREGHQPLEIADTIDRYRKFGIPMEAVADLLGITAQWAYNIHGLLRLDTTVQELLKPREEEEDGEENGKRANVRPQFPIVAAIHISRLPDKALQRKLAARVQSGEVTLTHLRQEVVRVAADSGVEIRLRVESPFKQWERREQKLRGLLKFADGLESLLANPTVKNIAREHKRETMALRRDLLRIRDKLTAADMELSRLVG